MPVAGASYLSQGAGALSVVIENSSAGNQLTLSVDSKALLPYMWSLNMLCTSDGRCPGTRDKLSYYPCAC